MKKIIKKMNEVIQIILMAPVKLPGKMLNIIKYIGLGLGIIESVIVEKDEQDQKDVEPVVGAEAVQLLSDSQVLESDAERVTDADKTMDRVLNGDPSTGKEGVNETK